MVLHIDTDRMEALGLTDREMWLYLTLTILSARKPWKGTDEELAAKCKNNLSRATINRLKTNLIQKGLLTDGEDGISPAQNEQASAQNEHNSAQNEQNSKEKEKKQKKIEKGNNNLILKQSERELTHAREREKEELLNDLFDMEIIPVEQQKKPTYCELYKIAVCEFGYLNPYPLVEDMRSYYNANGWLRGDKRDILRHWLRNEPKMKGGRKPTLTEEERIVMRTFMDKIEPRLVERMCQVLRDFEVNKKDIRFYVDQEKQNKFAQWLTAIDAPKILAAYNREIKVAKA